MNMMNLRTRMTALLTAVVLAVMPLSGCGMQGRKGATLPIDLTTAYVSEPVEMQGFEVDPVCATSHGMVVRHVSGKVAKYYLYDQETKDYTLLPTEEEYEHGFFADLPDGRLCGIFQQRTGRKAGAAVCDQTHFIRVIYNERCEVAEEETFGDFSPEGSRQIKAMTADGSMILHDSTLAENTHTYVEDKSDTDTDYVLDPDFTVRCEIRQNGFYLADYLIGRSGTVYGMTSEEATTHLYRVDLTQGTAEPAGEKEFPFRSDQAIASPADGEHELYFVNQQGIYGMDLGETPQLIVDFANSDFFGEFYRMLALPGRQFTGNFIGSGFTRDDGNYLLRPRTEEELAETKCISLAGVDISPSLIREISNYNRSQTGCHIFIKDYLASYVSNDTSSHEVVLLPDNADPYAEQKQKALEDFKNDLLNDIIPDIICMDGMPYQLLSNKGLLTDLAPRLERDDRFVPEDYCTNLLDGLKKGDRLERIGFSFRLTTAAAKTKWVGEQQGRTPREYIAMLESVPEDMELFDSPSREACVANYLTGAQSAFINKDTMTCMFASPEFIKLLELTNSIRTNDAAADDPYYREEEDIAYSADKRLLCITDLTKPYNYHEVHYQVYHGQHYFEGEDITLVGFPDASGGNGGRYQMDYLLALTTCSAMEKPVWEFFMQELSSVNQSTMCMDAYGESNALPLHKASLDNCLKAATINTGTGMRPGASEQEMDIVRDYIYNVRMYAENDPTITAIISEEAGMYFAGDQTAKEAADMIQSRCSLYLSEQK